MRANYPAVDGLDRLFMGCISELAYADGNRRGFLDLNVTTDQVNGAFHLLSGTNPLTNAPACAIETVTGSADLSLTLAAVLDASPSSPPRPFWAPWCSDGKPTSMPSPASTVPSMPRAWARCRRQRGGPGSANNRNAALRADNLVTELQGLRVVDNPSSVTTVTIAESTVLAPFAFAGANSDGISH